MKNIWKLLMIALLAFAMIGCPTAKEDSDDDDDAASEEPDNRVVISYPAAAEVATNGIYEAKIFADGLSTTDWGANADGPTIKIIFVTQAVANAIIDGEIANDSDLFTAENNCYVYCNNDIDNGHFEVLTNGSDKAYSDVIGKGAKYEGLLVSKADASGDYTAIVDMNKINQDQLLKKGGSYIGKDGKPSDETTDGVDAITDLASRIPLFIGSISFNQGKAKGIKAPLSFWNAGVLFGEPSTKTWPNAADIKTHDITVVNKDVSTYQFLKGNIGDFPLTFTDGVATVEFDYTGEEAAWDAGQAANIEKGAPEFGITSDADWSEKFVGATLAALDTDYAMTYSGSSNNLVTATLTVGTTYVITITKVGEDGAKVKIAAKD